MLPYISLEAMLKQVTRRDDNSDGGEIIRSRPDDLVWMQFTGKQDAKGRDIYEGDALRCANGSAGYVEWVEKALGFKVNCNEPGWCHPIDGWDGSTAEVVGNIHENPNLLETT